MLQVQSVIRIAIVAAGSIVRNNQICAMRIFSPKYHRDLLLEERDGPCFLAWQIIRSLASELTLN